MKLTLLSTSVAFLSATAAFMPSNLQASRTSFLPLGVASADSIVKPTGTSFLPKDTVERCESGSPIEKAKIQKDATSAWVDVYEYARKIREGEMTWEDVEKADLDTVSPSLPLLD